MMTSHMLEKALKKEEVKEVTDEKNIEEPRKAKGIHRKTSSKSMER